MKRLILMSLLVLSMCGVSTAVTDTTVVASVSFIGETDAIPSTVILTPVNAHSYRISVYMETSDFVNNASQIACGFIGWTGDFSTYDYPASGDGICLYTSVATATTTYVEDSIVIHSAPGQPITFHTVIGDFGTPGVPPVAPYNAYVTVEKLD
jgi:hypothetical protein